MTPAGQDDWIEEDDDDETGTGQSSGPTRLTFGHGSDAIEGGDSTDHIILSGIVGQATEFLIEDAATYNARTQSRIADATVLISADGILMMSAKDVELITIDAGTPDDTLVANGNFSNTSLAGGAVRFNARGDGAEINLDGLTSPLKVIATHDEWDGESILAETVCEDPPRRSVLRTPVPRLNQTRQAFSEVA